MAEPEPTRDGDAQGFGVIPALLVVALAGWLGAYLVRAYWDASGESVPPWVADAQSVALVLAGLVLCFVLLSGDRREPCASTEPEAWLCKHCLKPYVPGAHFCPRCGAPQTFYACTATYEQIYAQMWCLGKAALVPSRPLHVVGVVLGALALLLEFAWDLTSWPDRGMAPLAVAGRTLLSAMLFLLLWICARLAYLGIRNYARRSRDPEGATSEIEYGSPPWWTYDAEWALPDGNEGEVEDEGGPPPLPTPPPAG